MDATTLVIHGEFGPLNLLFEARGLMRVGHVARTAESPIEEFVWAHPERPLEVRVCNNLSLDLCYVVLGGDARGPLVQELVDRGCVDGRRALEMAAGVGDRPAQDQVDCASTLGVLAPQRYDGAFFDALSRFLRSPISRVRLYAIDAAAFTGWREFIPVLQEMLGDEVDLIQWHAEEALDAYEAGESPILLNFPD